MEPDRCKHLSDRLRWLETSLLNSYPVCRAMVDQEQRKILEEYKKCLKEQVARNKSEDRPQSRTEIQY